MQAQVIGRALEVVDACLAAGPVVVHGDPMSACTWFPACVTHPSLSSHVQFQNDTAPQRTNQGQPGYL
ncbi:jg26067 [Pararge aegeria aegeria]|uniref:Jg26067 protein n=1 Tax=Pararge aegeria aegeria TaxID=348720 RepID=A0A8S4RTL0_9NEOP|nr:jg26067 [Pararge aegeria aegeria]